MIEFHQHPEGVIYLRGTGGSYGADLATFTADAAALSLPPLPALPAGQVERRYYRSDSFIRHDVSDGSTQSGAPVPWTEGEAYVAAYPSLLAAQAAREEPPAPGEGGGGG